MAIIVQPLSHVYKINIGEIVFYCKQLSYRQRSIIAAKHHQQSSGTHTQDVVGLLFEVLRHSITKVEGLENPDGSTYELKFENGILTDDCLDELFYLEKVGDVLQLCASNFLTMKIPSEFIGMDGKPMDGVSVEKVPADKKK